MRWHYGLAILVFLLLSFLLWERSVKNRLINQLQTQSLRKQVDTLRIETEKKVVEYKNRAVHNKRITEKWNNIRDTITQTNIDTIYLQAQNDIKYLDTSLKKCDTALNSCLAYSNAQKELIKLLESRKTPILISYVGVGLSMDKSLLVSPSAQVGIGLNLSKIFGKK